VDPGLESVLADRPKCPTEIIVVDNGSLDGTAGAVGTIAARACCRISCETVRQPG